MRAALLVPVVVLLAAACEQRPAPSARPPASQPAPVAPAPRVAKIVFLDKEYACDCTKKRTDATWAALQAALGRPAAVPVERIHLDSQAAKAEPYAKLKPLMVPPGLYFVDARNTLVELLQGEVTAPQIAAVLERR